MSRLTLLISSAGSLVGQNILDALAPVRDRLRIIGLNYDAENPRVFRCHKTYLAPQVDDEAAFTARLLDVIDRESPDLIFPGRDHDVLLLARVREQHPELARCIPCGPSWLAEMMQDKLQTWEFAAAHQVPFAETISCQSSDATFTSFLSRHPFPLIAKPQTGYGSLGVRIVFHPSQLEQVRQLKDYVVQPFLDADADLLQHVPDLSAGVPLFFGFPEERQYTFQATIGPDGLPCEPCYTINRMVMGRTDRAQRIDDPSLAEFAHRWLEALSAAGWRGSVNLQCRKLTDGSFSGFELNGRMSGSSSARCYLGFNEPQILTEQFVGPDRWPEASRPVIHPGFVQRSPTDGFVDSIEVEALKSQGEWTALVTAESEDCAG